MYSVLFLNESAYTYYLIHKWQLRQIRTKSIKGKIVLSSVYSHWPDTREFFTQTVELWNRWIRLSCYNTTEYRTRVHCIHLYHLFGHALVHVIYSGVSDQCSHTMHVYINVSTDEHYLKHKVKMHTYNGLRTYKCNMCSVFIFYITFKWCIFIQVHI